MILESDDHGYDEPMTDDDIEYARECARLADEEAFRDAADPHRHEVADNATTDDDPDPETIPW